MLKIKIDCEECGNSATVYTECKEEIVFCPFCGENIVVKYGDDEEENDLDDDWPVGGC